MFEKVVKTTSRFLKKHGSKILLGVGIVGTGAAGVYAVSKTPAALESIEAKQAEHPDEELTPKELVQATWKYYTPAISLYILSAGCLVSSGRIMCKEQAALTAAYEICRKSFEQYRQKTVETIGPQKELEMRRELLSDEVRNNPMPYYIEADDGKFPCRDKRTGAYFRTSINELDRGFNLFNEKLRTGSYMSQNEARYTIGLNLIDTDDGDMLGFNIDDGYVNYILGYEAGPGGRPAACIEFDRMPRAGFDRIF